MSTDAIAGAVPDVQQTPYPGLHSPPDSNNALKLEGSDSELSDIEDPEEDMGEIEPDYYADDGRVPVFKPTMDQFRSFKLYMNKINKYGMQSGIVKVIPPSEWHAALPPLDEAIKTIRVKEPIKQDIMGTSGTYRQANIVHQRSYNLPQWRNLCDQSEHQPPAKRGERRANQEKMARTAPRVKAGTGKRKSAGRTSKRQKATDEDENSDAEERLPTPVSPSHGLDVSPVKQEVGEGEELFLKPKGGRQPKAVASVSSRRKYNRRDPASNIDEAAFKDFNYHLEGHDYSAERCEELERAYWKTLTYAPPLYGADMPGSLFDEKTTSWNLGNLENLLDVLGTKIPGVNTAYLYLGMWKATFAWHLEDVDLYSINYLHFGAPKQWYSISQRDARRFEQAMKSIWPTDAKACDQFLRHKTFLISPSTLLQNHNIKVNKVVHHPGEFVITFPYGYHSGYNLGYNCAEAVNFALDSWMEYGKIAKKCDCDQAQDSVWIDIREIERKLRGDETDYEETEDEEEEEEEEDMTNDLPTPPASGGDNKAKAQKRKRKRPVNEKDGKAVIKKIRVRIKVPLKEPCALCPNDIPSEPLLPTDDGRKVHRICAQYIPETDIEMDGSKEVVINLASINKARMDSLKCGYCRSKKGACFQCSQGKCARSYHPTCAAAAGVWVEKGEIPVFGEDGTEYKEDGFEFSCRFHRSKREKKADAETLSEDAEIRKAASKLAVGAICQFQYLHPNDAMFAGTLVENRSSEEVLLVDILPRGDRVEVEYKYLRIPSASDFRMIKPSAKAIPLPTSHKAKQSLNTSKRLADDLPRKDDIFLEGFKWTEFVSHNTPRNAAQVNIDFTKENQIWYYLGKTSTEAKAQFTEDLAKPRHNPKGHFLDTIPKPVAATAVSRHSLSASFPSNPVVNQNALNAAMVKNRQPLPVENNSTSRNEKPYAYKPRLGTGSYPNGLYSVDQQAWNSQQNFLRQSAVQSMPSVAYGTDPRWVSSAPPADSRIAAPYTYSSNQGGQGQYIHTGYMVPPNTAPTRPSPVAAMKPNNPFSNRPSSSSGHSQVPVPPRPSNGVNYSRYSAKPDPFAKYPYLRKEHNRSPLDYKSPYSQSGGFMNGYEGNLKEYLQRNPDALFKMPRGPGQTSPSTTGSQLSQQEKEYPPILPPVRKAPAKITGPSHQNGQSTSQQQQLPAHQITKLTGVDPWQKKEKSQLHPAIRQEYSSMFHQQYQPPSQGQEPRLVPNPLKQAEQVPPQQNQSFAPILPPQHSTRPQPQPQPQQQTMFNIQSPQSQLAAGHQSPQEQQPQYPPQISPAYQYYATPPKHIQTMQPVPQPTPQPTPQPATLYAPAYQAPQAVEELKPVYAHQQYVQKPTTPLAQAPVQTKTQEQPQPQPELHSQPQAPPELADVPTDSTSLVEQMMANLRRVSASATSKSE